MRHDSENDVQLKRADFIWRGARHNREVCGNDRMRLLIFVVGVLCEVCVATFVNNSNTDWNFGRRTKRMEVRKR